MKPALKNNLAPNRTHRPEECKASPGECAECEFHACAPRLKKRWLTHAVVDGKFSIGCKHCAAMYEAGGHDVLRDHPGWKQWATMSVTTVLKHRKIKKHESSFRHRVAVQRSMGKSSRGRKLLLKMAPRRKDFETLWEHIKRRNSRRELLGICHRQKLYRMAWCLAESVRMRHRRFLQGASTIAIHSDKGTGRLLFRFTAANDLLERRSSLLGVFGMNGGAHETMKAVKRAFKTFCTPNAGRPASSKEYRSGDKVDSDCLKKDLFKKLVDGITHLWNADAASDCQHAGHALRRNAKSSSGQRTGTFKALEVVGWDASHGSRRLTSRPWASDDYLTSILDMLLLGNGKGARKRYAIVRLIQNSKEFREMFEDNMANMPNRVGKTKNFSFAGHRYDSTTKPLGRAVHAIYALIETALQIERLRKGKKEATIASEFLMFIDTEACVQMGMLADAAHEAISVTRATDKEDCNTEMLAYQVEVFLKKMHMLFFDANITDHGFTAWILQQLRSPLLIYLQGKPKLIGSRAGVCKAIIDRCRIRMCCWVRMTMEVKNAEYPHFSIFSSFSVFALPDSRGNRPAEIEGATVSKRIERLAGLTKVDAKDALAQYIDLFSMASVVKEGRQGCSNVEAWKEAIHRIHSMRASLRQLHPTDALLPMLVRWVGWSCSTSGVEHAFDVARGLFGPETRRLEDDRAADILLLATESMNSDDMCEIFKQAQLLWSKFFGVSRNGKPKGVAGPRLKPANANSEVGWLRNRRGRLEEATQSWSSAGGRVRTATEMRDVTGGAWTDEMQNECEFQRKKARKRLIQAHGQGLVLNDDIGDPAQFQREKIRFEKLEAANARKTKEAYHHRMTAKCIVQRPTFPNLNGTAIFIDKSVKQKQLEHCRRSAASLGARVTRARCEADFFIVDNVANIGQRNEWFTALFGRSVMTPEYFRSRGVAGFVIARTPATRTSPLTLWASPAFVERHSGLYDIVDLCMGQPGNRWSWYEGTIAELARNYLAKKKKVVCLVTPGDIKAHKVLRDAPFSFQHASFLTHVSKVSLRNSTLGATGVLPAHGSA